MKRLIWITAACGVAWMPPAAPRPPGPREVFHGVVSADGSSRPDAVLRGVEAGAPYDRPALPGIRIDPSTYRLFSLRSLLIDPEIYHDFIPRDVNLSPLRPVILSVRPYESAGGTPAGLIETETLAEITGRNLENTVRIRAGGLESLPLVARGSYVVARLDGIGRTEVRVQNNRGHWSAAAETWLVRVLPERGPPAVLRAGESATAGLRVVGTAAPVRLVLEADSSSVSFSGRRTLEAVSSGGERNSLRISIRADRAGPYRIFCRIAAQQGF